jgi:hypothetical protein
MFGELNPFCLAVENDIVSGAATRTVIWCVLAVIAVWDTLAFSLGWPTISHCLRSMDEQSGTLLRWVMLALWLHLFLPAWYAQNGN